MAYSFMTIQKVKNMGTLKSKYNHNCRKVEVSNVIPEFINDNDTLVKLPVNENGELDYAEAVKKRIEELDYYKDHKVGKNQVLAYEIVMTFSKDEGIDIDEWEKRSVQWLKDTFDVAPDGKSNVLHAICHKDEPGNVHIHAIVTPIDDRGHLNAKYFTNGFQAMTNLQTSYAKSVEDLGLERGIAGSSARHKDIRKFYAELNNAIENVPEVLAGETADEYRRRTFEYQQEQMAAIIRKKNEYEAEMRRKMDKENNDTRRILREEYEDTMDEIQEHRSTIKSYKKQIDELEEELIDKQNIYDKYMEEINKNAIELARINNLIATKEQLIEYGKEYSDIKEGLIIIGENDPDIVLQTESLMNNAKEVYSNWKLENNIEDIDIDESDLNN